MKDRTRGRRGDDANVGADSDLAPLKAKHPVTGRSIQVDLENDVTIGPDIREELRETSRRFAFYLQLLDVARDDLRVAQHLEYCEEEDLYIPIKESVPKATETEIKTRVKAHPKMRQAFRVRMEAEERYKHAESAVASMEKKARLLGDLARLEAASMNLTGQEEREDWK